MTADIRHEAAYVAGAKIAVDITIEERRQIRIVNDIAAHDRTGSTMVLIVSNDEDRGCCRIWTGTVRVENEVAFVFWPAEIYARDSPRAHVIDFLAPLLADVGDDDVAVIEREAVGLAQTIGIDLITAVFTDVRIVTRNAIGAGPVGQRFDPQHLAEKTCEVARGLTDRENMAAAIASRHVEVAIARAEL